MPVLSALLHYLFAETAEISLKRAESSGFLACVVVLILFLSRKNFLLEAGEVSLIKISFAAFWSPY